MDGENAAVDSHVAHLGLVGDPSNRNDRPVLKLKRRNLAELGFRPWQVAPITMKVETARRLENAVQFDAAWAHEVDVGAGRGVAIGKGPLLLGFPPKHLVVAVGVEGRVEVGQVNAGVRQLGQFLDVVPAVDDAGVHQWGSAFDHGG